MGQPSLIPLLVLFFSVAIFVYFSVGPTSRHLRWSEHSSWHSQHPRMDIVVSEAIIDSVMSRVALLCFIDMRLTGITADLVFRLRNTQCVQDCHFTLQHDMASALARAQNFSCIWGEHVQPTVPHIMIDRTCLFWAVGDGSFHGCFVLFCHPPPGMFTMHQLQLVTFNMCWEFQRVTHVNHRLTKVTLTLQTQLYHLTEHEYPRINTWLRYSEPRVNRLVLYASNCSESLLKRLNADFPQVYIISWFPWHIERRGLGASYAFMMKMDFFLRFGHAGDYSLFLDIDEFLYISAPASHQWDSFARTWDAQLGTVYFVTWNIRGCHANTTEPIGLANVAARCEQTTNKRKYMYRNIATAFPETHDHRVLPGFQQKTLNVSHGYVMHYRGFAKQTLTQCLSEDVRGCDKGPLIPW